MSSGMKKMVVGVVLMIVGGGLLALAATAGHTVSYVANKKALAFQGFYLPQ